jgi:hypothetical protein
MPSRVLAQRAHWRGVKAGLEGVAIAGLTAPLADRRGACGHCGIFVFKFPGVGPLPLSRTVTV